MNTMQSASTAQAPSARPAPRQSIAVLFALPIASAAASTMMARPYQRGKNAGPGPSGDDVPAERDERQPGPEVRGSAEHLLLLFPGRLARQGALRLWSLRRLGLRLPVAALRHDLADDAARRAELHRHHARIADDLAA